MNNKLDRKYFVLRTNSSDAIGLLSLVVPSNEMGMFEFSLHQLKYKDQPNEFLDLMYTEMNFPEYETHRDAFETYDELEVVQIWAPTGTAVPITVTVKQKDKADDDES
jgi:hypothetical protein